MIGHSVAVRMMASQWFLLKYFNCYHNINLFFFSLDVSLSSLTEKYEPSFCVCSGYVHVQYTDASDLSGGSEHESLFSIQFAKTLVFGQL